MQLLTLKIISIFKIKFYEIRVHIVGRGELYSMFCYYLFGISRIGKHVVKFDSRN